MEWSGDQDIGGFELFLENTVLSLLAAAYLTKERNIRLLDKTGMEMVRRTMNS
jgi:hypothetical protein